MSHDGGAIAVVLTASAGFLFWQFRRRAWEARNPSPDMGLGATAWVWPIPTLGDRAPVISDGWGSRRTRPDGTTRSHLGADLMYRRMEPLDLRGVFPPGTKNGSAWHFMPDNVPVLAAGEGVVAFAGPTARGFTVVIEHAADWATYYTHLAQLDVAAGQRVSPGTSLGSVGFDPTDRRKLKHLHFELWRGRARDGAIDPAPFLAAWPTVTSTVYPLFAVRNAGLVYRPVGARGEPYPAWVRDLKQKSGIYVIRQAGETVYVGESHSNKLYETLTRHFQTWRRWKGFWQGQYGEGHDPGLTYQRDSVEVAVRTTPADEAIDEEARLIQRLRPRDNLLGQPPELEEVPF